MKFRALAKWSWKQLKGYRLGVSFSNFLVGLVCSCCACLATWAFKLISCLRSSLTTIFFAFNNNDNDSDNNDNDNNDDNDNNNNNSN